MFLSGKVSDITSGQQLITETFTSSTTWTAPAGVTNLISAEGKGSDDTEGSWTSYFVNIFVGPSCSSGSQLGSTLPWSTVIAQMDSMVSAANQVTTNSAGATGYSGIWNYSYLWCGSQNQWLLGSVFSQNPGETWRRVGTLTNPITGTGNVPTSTYTNYSASGGVLEKFSAGSAGTSATGFGRTFPGGASPTTFTNVTVTPGQSYTLSIPSPGGYISIKYYQ